MPACAQHPDEQRAAHRHQHGRMVQVAQPDERARRRTHHPGPLEADERQEEPDPGRDRVLERRRDRIDQPLAEPDQ